MPEPSVNKAKLQKRFALVAIVGLCAGGWIMVPRSGAVSALVSGRLAFLVGDLAGQFAFALLHNLTGGAWGWRVRDILVAAASTLPLVGLLFLPIAL